VPVTTDGREVVVGFDQRKLKAMADRNRGGPGLGLRVADNKDGGALVGGVKDDSPAARAGLQAGDVVIELSGVPVNTVADLEQVAGRWSRDRPTSMTIQRDGERKTLILYG
jgi:S1-C subfamily serine protease